MATCCLSVAAATGPHTHPGSIPTRQMSLDTLRKTKVRPSPVARGTQNVRGAPRTGADSVFSSEGHKTSELCAREAYLYS